MSTKALFSVLMLSSSLSFAQTTDLAFQPAPAAKTTVTTAATEDAGAFFTRFVGEVLNGKDLAAASEFYAPTYRHHGLPEELQPVAVEAFQAWSKSFNTAFPDARWTIDFVSAQGNVVAYALTLTATHQGTYLGQPATHKPIVARETGIARLENGRIVEVWSTFDDYAVAQQLGIKKK